MFMTALIAVAVTTLLGLATRYVLQWRRIDNYNGSRLAVTWKEFLAVSLAMSIVVAPSIIVVGKQLSVANIVTYEQWLNGIEQQPIDSVTNCYAGRKGNSAEAGKSNCEWTYVSDTYIWEEVWYTTECDSEGKNCYQKRNSTWHKDNVYTPYVTREHRYSIPTTFGFKDGPTYTFPGAYLDDNPVAFGAKPIPGDAPRGAPKDWLDAKARWDDDNPRPVTALDSYDNYILASDNEVLKAYSAHIKRYKDAGLLPAPTQNLMSDDPMVGEKRFQANKVVFAGVTVSDEQALQASLMQFNAALGMKLQGDLHVVLVDSSMVPANEAITYVNAYKAFAQDEDPELVEPIFKKRALAKNAIVLALGISDDSTIEWAESTTGMPFGNELMAQFVRDYVPGTQLTPEALFGAPRTTYDGEEVHIALSSEPGILESIMFVKAPFARASMSCEDEGENCVGFKDLLDTIEPTGWQKFWMVFIVDFIAVILWGVVAAGSFFGSSNSTLPRRFTRTRPYEFTGW